MSVSVSAAATPRLVRTDPSLLERVGRDSLYLLTGFPLALVSFVVLITGLATSAGLAVVWVGIPLAALTLVAGQLFAEIERARLRGVGLTLPPAVYRPMGSGSFGWLVLLRDTQRWRDAVHGLVLLPVATVTWSVAVSWWTVAVAGSTSRFWSDRMWSTWLADSSEHRGLASLLGYQGQEADVVVNTILGVVFLLTLPPVLRMLSRTQSELGRILLGSGQNRQSVQGFEGMDRP